MPVAQHLLAILRCPKSKSELIYFSAGVAGAEEFLFCPASRLRYRIEESIPVMLVDEAIALDAQTCEELQSKARELGLVQD